MNRLGLGISYDEMERIDFNLAYRVIQDDGDNCVPIGGKLSSGQIIHGAMDNFDHDENACLRYWWKSQ